MNTARRGARMITTKVRKGVYTISFHGEGYLVVKRSFWYCYRLRVQTYSNSTSARYNACGGTRWDSFERDYVPIDGLEHRYDSLGAFQFALKEVYAEQAMEGLT